MKEYSIIYNSVIGPLKITVSDTGLSHLEFDAKAESNSNGPYHSLLIKTIKQLDEYFQGKLKVFNIPLDIKGTEFQKHVWHEVGKIEYGMVTTYQNIAKSINNVKAMRAVGLANGSNPIPIIIPCHRVFGSNGRLTGYGGGLWRKEWLLRHEGAILI